MQDAQDFMREVVTPAAKASWQGHAAQAGSRTLQGVVPAMTLQGQADLVSASPS